MSSFALWNYRTHALTSIVFSGWLVDDGAVLQTPQIKHANTAILTTAHKDICTISAESYIIHFLVVGDELSLGCQGWDIPYRTGRIYARGDDQARGHCVPV